MLIIGTGGLASDILSSMQFDEPTEGLCFYNDTTIIPRDYISQNYPVITELSEAEGYFKKVSNRFIVAVGNNSIRKRLTEKFESINGINPNYISSRALVGKYVSIGAKGVVIMHHAAIGNGCSVGSGSVIYTNASLGHGSNIGEYALVSGNVCMSDTEIGDFSTVGIGASFKPGVKIGHHAFVSVGSVVNKDISSGYIASGNPARALKRNIYNEDSE
jgi:sugar O-acyltransferase (sialic acid O-acetyltransferase NeuD family)